VGGNSMLIYRKFEGILHQGIFPLFGRTYLIRAGNVHSNKFIVVTDCVTVTGATDHSPVRQIFELKKGSKFMMLFWLC
jgi:hypothetical protein